MTDTNETSSPPDILTRLAAIDKRLDFLQKYLGAIWDAHMEERKIVSEKFERAFERIKNIEVFVFPNLLQDIEDVHQIIGGIGPPAEQNPLDSRKTAPIKNGEPDIT